MGRKKLTTEEFIIRAKDVHGDKYGYSLVKYKNRKTKVKIICKEHGEFEQTPDDHLQGKGCKKCSKPVYDTNSFIRHSKLIHGDKYDYSLVEYKLSKVKVKIICKEHGVFEQNPNTHLRGHGCNSCKKETKKVYDTNTFIKEAEIVHGNKFDYSLVEYSIRKDKVKIVCSIHGDFIQRPNDHLQGASCPKCKSSKGETSIRKYLTNNNINFEEQKRYKECKNKISLPFDFYLSDYNLIIEYDGEFHYKAIFSQEDLKQTQQNDEIKNKYCADNGINLLRIKYTDFKHIEDILEFNLKLYKQEKGVK